MPCESCGMTLFYKERKYGQQFCKRCATERGLSRICDACIPTFVTDACTPTLVTDAGIKFILPPPPLPVLEEIGLRLQAMIEPRLARHLDRLARPQKPAPPLRTTLDELLGRDP